MATSLIGGLIKQGYDAALLHASDPNADALAALSRQYDIATAADNQQYCSQSQIIVLAVKPQVMKAVAATLRGQLSHQPLIISIAAGITTAQLQRWLTDETSNDEVNEKSQTLAIVRCMPNTPALVQLGATGLFANAQTTAAQRQCAQALMDAVGKSIWLDDEAALDVVTAVSGSGPAYFFLLMEAMIDAAVKQGLSPQQAQTLTLQTALGAASLAQQSDIDISTLRQRVTSPGGTTEQAIQRFESGGLRTLVDDAMQACADHSRKMSAELKA